MGEYRKTSDLERTKLLIIVIFRDFFMHWRDAVVFALCLTFYFGTTGQKAKPSVAFFSGRECRANEPVLTQPLLYENWLISPRKEGVSFSMRDNIKGIGLVVAIDEENIVFEDRLRDAKGSVLRQPGVGVVFLPPVNPEIAEQFCRCVQDVAGKEEDRVWLCNGDELLGTLVRMDSRRLWIRSFGVELIVPRHRVRAVRFGTKRS